MVTDGNKPQTLRRPCPSASVSTAHVTRTRLVLNRGALQLGVACVSCFPRNETINGEPGTRHGSSSISVRDNMEEFSASVTFIYPAPTKKQVFVFPLPDTPVSHLAHRIPTSDHQIYREQSEGSVLLPADWLQGTATDGMCRLLSCKEET
jgi:hypothetical protein